MVSEFAFSGTFAKTVHNLAEHGCQIIYKINQIDYEINKSRMLATLAATMFLEKINALEIDITCG